MSHKFKIVNKICLFFGWSKLKLSQFLYEDVVMKFELFEIMIRLSFDDILKLGQGHLSLVLIHRKCFAI